MQLLELRLFFNDSHLILNPADEHLDLIVLDSLEDWSAACLGRRATDCSRWIYLKL